MNEQYIENLLRFLGAASYSQLVISASREMFARSWYQLGPEERNAVTVAVNNQIQSNTVGLTQDLLKAWLNQSSPAGQVGFQPPPSGTQQAPTPKSEPVKPK